MKLGIRTTAVACLLFVLLTYAGSYYWLSRRGMREAALLGHDDVFAYVPIAQLQEGKNSVHDFLLVLYFPANAIDRRFFDGWSPYIYETLSG